MPDPSTVVASSPSGMTVGWWVLLAAPVAADIGIPLPGTSQDAAARAQEVKFLRTDLSENLLLTTAKAGGGGAVFVVPFLKASPWRSSRSLSVTSGGNPRSVDRMMVALWCHFSLGGVIHGGAHGLGEQRTVSLVEWYFILYIDGGGSWWRGAVEIRSPMRRDELVQGGGAVWRCGGVDDS